MVRFRVSASFQRQLDDLVPVDLGNVQLDIPVGHGVVPFGDHLALTDRADRLDLGVARVHAHALVEQRNLLVDRVQVGGRLLAGVVQAMQHQRIARTRTAQLHLQPADRMPVILAHQLPRHQQIEDVGEYRLDPRRGEILVDAEQRVGEINDVAVPRRRGEPDPPGRGGMLMGAEIPPLTIEVGFDRIQQHPRSRRPHPRATLVHDELLFG